MALILRTRSFGAEHCCHWHQTREVMMDIPALGIDVSKDTLDVNVILANKPLGKQFANTEAGWRALIGWLKHRKLGQVHACLEATGRYSLGAALALHEAGHLVSIINPAQIRDFVRTRLGRNKSDKADAAHIREYGALFKPPAWQPPSPALRRLCDLQTMRAGFVASKVEWQNRATSLGDDVAARALADATIAHFVGQIATVEQAIAETIDHDDDLRGKRDLLLTISGVGETLAAVILAELPGTEVITSSAQAVAYAGLNPRRFQSGSSINHPTRISKIGNATLRAALFMPALTAMCHNRAVAALVQRLRTKGQLKGKQIVVAAMRKLLVICFGVLKTGRPFDATVAMPA
jgi:transposase